MSLSIHTSFSSQNYSSIITDASDMRIVAGITGIIGKTIRWMLCVIMAAMIPIILKSRLEK
jgi:hypothetical protein